MISSAVASHTIGCTGEIEAYLGHIRPNQRVERDRIGAGQWLKLDLLNLINIQSYIRSRIEDMQACATCAQLKCFSGCRATNHEYIGAALTLDHIAPTRHIPGDLVGAGTGTDRIIPTSAIDPIVPAGSNNH